MARVEGAQPVEEPPRYPRRDDPKYQYRWGKYHYKAFWQLIHDNLMDLGRLAYAHLHPIGGNARLYMSWPESVSYRISTAAASKLRMSGGVVQAGIWRSAT